MESLQMAPKPLGRLTALVLHSFSRCLVARRCSPLIPMNVRPFLIVMTSLAFAVAARAVEIVAHRGASFDAPENTMAATRLAWKQKADAVETDIYLSKDGKIVVSHDKTGKR